MAIWRTLGWALAALLGVLAPRVLAETVDLKTHCKFAGKVGDLNQTTQKFGMRLQIGMRSMNYSGQLQQTLLQETAPGKVTLWLGMSNLKLTIGQTNIVGGPGSAACGPIDVVMGHQKPLWLAFDIEADTKANSGQFVVKDVRFQLPADNWAVGQPAWVKTAGIGFTQQNVTQGLRQGIAKERFRLQDKLKKDASKILSQVVRLTTPKDSVSPVVQAIRSRLTRPTPQTISATP